jgi:hypothetical protein
METAEAGRLAHIERTYMRRVRRYAPDARLIGVPIDIKSRWRKYARLYCAYLVARGSLISPSTIFVSIPEQRELEVCLLRVNGSGRVRLLH